MISLNFANIFLYNSLIIVSDVLTILVFIHMIYKKRTPTGIIAWLLFMILVPYVAVLLYLIFGLRKRENRYKKNPITLQKRTQIFHKQNPIHDILKSYGIADATGNEYFELFTDSVGAYEKLLSCIKDAQTSIYISTYIFVFDEVTKEIIDELIKKAKEGLEIKLLMDSLGSLGLYIFQNKLKELKRAGVKVEFFMPVFKMPFRNYINLRNHRKIYIFDNKKVLSGGMNISHEYFGPNIDKARWKDIFFLCEGASAELFFEIFASDWFYASQEKIEFIKNDTVNVGDTFLQVVPSGPDMRQDVLYEALLCAIYSAKKRIWIVTPYFIPNDSIMEALIIAKHKGVDVKLITPKDSNHFLVNLTRSSYMRELEEVGIEVALYNGAMLHAKAILFDNTSTMLGSVNLDNRSLFLNYEVAVFVYSHKTIADIELWMNKLLLSSSDGLKKISTSRVIVENLMRIIAPQL